MLGGGGGVGVGGGISLGRDCADRRFAICEIMIVGGGV